MRFRVLRVQVRAFVASALLAFACLHFAQGQGPQTSSSGFTLDSQQPGADTPVKIVSVELDARELNDGKFFAISGDRSLKGLTITIQNTSTQAIVEAGIKVIGWSSAANPVVMSSFLGAYPPAALFRPDGSLIDFPAQAPILVEPGAQIQFRFSTSAADAEEGRFAELAQHDGATLTVELATIYFVNGTRWSKGSYFISGDTPGAWTRISAAQFKSLSQSIRK